VKYKENGTNRAVCWSVRTNTITGCIQDHFTSQVEAHNGRDEAGCSCSITALPKSLLSKHVRTTEKPSRYTAI